MDDRLGNDYRDEQKAGKAYNNSKTEKALRLEMSCRDMYMGGD